MHYLPFFTFLIAVPGFLVQLRTFSDGGGLDRKSGTRRRIRRIKHLEEVTDRLGPDHCPEEVIQELSAAQRDLASLYAVIPDSNERDVTGNSLMIGLPTAIVSQLLLLQPIPLGKDLGIGVYIVSIVFIAHVLGPRRRMRSRRLLYGRFGGRPDTPALPSMSRWPFVSRRLGQIRLNKWLIQTLGGAPRPPENITDEEISKLTDLIDQWHANPWWRRVLRAWIITAGAVRRMTRSLPSHEPDSAYAPPE